MATGYSDGFDFSSVVIPDDWGARWEASAIAAEVGEAVATWREEARRLRISAAETERMSSAFEHDDLDAATGAG